MAEMVWPRDAKAKKYAEVKQIMTDTGDDKTIGKISKDELKNGLFIDGAELDPIKGGDTSAAATVIAPGPAGQMRKREASPGWYSVNGSAIEAAKGKRWVWGWSGTAWSLYNMGDLPKTPAVNSLTSTSTEDALSANQGRVLDGKITTTMESIPDVEPLETEVEAISLKVNGIPDQFEEYKSQVVQGSYFGSRGNLLPTPASGNILSDDSRAGYVLLQGLAAGTRIRIASKTENIGSTSRPLYAFTNASNQIRAVDVSGQMDKDTYNAPIDVIWPDNAEAVRMYINVRMAGGWSNPDSRFSVKRMIPSGDKGMAHVVEEHSERLDLVETELDVLQGELGNTDISAKTIKPSSPLLSSYSSENFAAAKFYARRFGVELLRMQIAGAKNIYLASDGADSNNGLSEATAVRTIARAAALMASGDALLVKRGSVFEEYGIIQNKNNILINVYGSGANPLFNNLVTIPSGSIEKVAGYNNIYRFQRSYDACVKDRGMAVVFVDGVRCGRDIQNYMNLTEEQAMPYLEANPGNAAWFSQRYSAGWPAGNYYMYFSLADAPSNHKIESVNKWSAILEITNCKNVDIRHIEQRGSGFRDGVAYGSTENVYCEDCGFLDHAWHGIVYNDIAFHDCRIISRSGAVGYQYHWLSNSLRHPDLIISKPTVISGYNMGAAFNGHETKLEQVNPFQNLVVENAYVESVDVVARSGIVEKTSYNKIAVKDINSICGGVSDRDAVLSNFYGTLKRSISINESSVIAPYIQPGRTLTIRDSILVVEDIFGRPSIMHTTNNLATGRLILDNVVILIKSSAASIVAPLFRNTSFNAAEFEFRNVIFVADKTAAFNHSATTFADAKFENCVFINTPLSGINLPAGNEVYTNYNEIKKVKYQSRLSYIQNGAIKTVAV
ncbi:hypothetical protein [Sphingobacterium deserti]|nr:hypothetical protein [Sphingobacterium deserti]